MKKLKCATILFLLLSSVYAKAQVYSLNPLRLDVEIAPGESKDFPIKITNLTNTLLDYKIEINELIYSKAKGRLDYNDKTSKNPRSLVQFARLSVTKFNIKPKDTTVVNLNITVPKDMKGSGYFRFTVIQPQPKNVKGFGLQILQNFTGQVRVGLKGTIDRQFSLANASYDNNKVAFTIENKGNVFLRVKANAFVLKNGKPTTKIPVSNKNNEDEFNILPDTSLPVYFNIDPKLVSTGKEKTKILINFYDEKSHYSSSKTMDISK
jgi:uncharacterized membrane protein